MFDPNGHLSYDGRLKIHLPAMQKKSTCQSAFLNLREMERMAQHTKQPEVLRELFEALGNDPFVNAECLARPALAERLLTSWYAHDQRIHGDLKQRAKAELEAHAALEQMKQSSGKYS
jgi:hypothetical protein